MMTEESVTKAILRYLIDRGWSIISFDFPQSGTGRSLRPNGCSSKNEGVLIPDVVAMKDSVSIYMEDKDHYYPEDFWKVYNVLHGRTHSESFLKVLGVRQDSLMGGIGLPESSCESISEDVITLVDFVLKVLEDGTVEAHYIAQGKDIEF